MLLVTDIGNSSITIGFFKNDFLLKTLNFPYQADMQVDSFEQLFLQLKVDKEISACTVASVAGEITYKICTAITNVFGVIPVLITSNMDLGINIKADNHNKIGIDRIANVHEVCKHYTEPVIVVDFGTATTFDITDGKNNFIGGIIMPGIGTQLKSLADNTSKLEQVDLKELENLRKTINIDTNLAILSGVVKGHAYSAEGLLADCIKELDKKPILVATGGFAPLITKHITRYTFDNVDTQLTIKGYYSIYKLNKD